MQQMAQQQQPRSPSLSAILTPESLSDLIQNLSEEEQKGMLEHLPEGQQSLEHLQSNLSSP